jgi:hypothetical protein
MTELPGRIAAFARRAFEIIVLFAGARVIGGVAMIALFSRDSVAWGWEITVVLAVAFACALMAALAVRWWAPPRRLGARKE